MRIEIEERTLHFKQPAGTSRGVYTERRIWLVTVTDGSAVGIGECAPLPKLSCDDIPNYAEVLRHFCDEVERTGEIPYEALRDYPSMLFGLETAFYEVRRKKEEGRDVLFDTPFSRGEVGIPINGLVWMGTFDEMRERIEQKLEQGFRCVKLKIGAIDFDAELELIKQIRGRFSRHEVELRVDANGAFRFDEALYKLELLSQYALHSIEQPIKAGQWANMAELCRESPLPIIILKPSLHGGMMGVREWVDTARDMGIGSWITSALESNIGLNAIAQLCSDIYGDAIKMPQGLGTGQLFTDNIPMPLEIRGDQLWRSEQ